MTKFKNCPRCGYEEGLIFCPNCHVTRDDLKLAKRIVKSHSKSKNGFDDLVIEWARITVDREWVPLDRASVYGH